MRARKRNRLEQRTRDLINAVDLDEPQIQPLTLDQAIRDQRLDLVAHNLLEKYERPIDAVHETLVKISVEDAPDMATVAKLANELVRQTEPSPVEEQELPEDMPKTSAPPPARKTRQTITPERRKEIGDAYLAGMPIAEISAAWDVAQATIYSTLNVLKIPRRTTEPEPEVSKASEEVSLGEPSPPPPNGVVSDLPTWTVTFSFRTRGNETVHAASFNDAAQVVLDQYNLDDIEILSVAKVTA